MLAIRLHEEFRVSSTTCPRSSCPDLAHYQKFLIGKLLALSMVREVQSSIAINTLKAGAPLPLDHLGVAQSSSNSRSAT